MIRTKMALVFLLSIALLIFSKTAHCQASKTDTIESSKDSVTVFQNVEVEASVDAGLWRSHLEKNLLPYIEKAASKRMPVGSYIVNIRFLVEKDGSITDVKAMNDPGYGLAEGAVKVLRSGPKWKPGSINGRPVRSYHTQPIGFVISQGQP